MPVTATTVFLPIEENSQEIEAFASPWEEEVEADDADISIRLTNT